MLVYRVETADGKGPYNGWGFGDMTEAQMNRHMDMSTAHSNKRTHPTPQVDRVWQKNPQSKRFGDGYLFGFGSRADLTAWFGGWGEHLADCGYRVNVYRVPLRSVIAGRNQVAARKFNMTPLRSLPITKLIP
jgi:hypothetical protein